MAYRVDEIPEEKEKFSIRRYLKWKLPPITGKFGLSLMLGRKEIFVGVAVADVEIEKIVKRKKVSVMAPKKAKVTTWQFS